MTDEFTHLEAKASDPQIQERGRKLVNGLIERTDAAQTTAILFIALNELFLALLHAQSPNPDTNIASMRTLVERLSETIDEHESCAQHNRVSAPRVH